jgi:hypothetical protein
MTIVVKKKALGMLNEGEKVMRSLAVLLVVVLMAGCSSFDTRTFTGLTTAKADSRLGTIIYTSSVCPSEMSNDQINEEIEKKSGDTKGRGPLVAAPLIAAGVSLAATYIVSSIDKAIEEYKKGLSGSLAAAGIATTVPENKSCILIVRGVIGKMKQKPGKAENENGDFLVKYSYALGLQDYPAFYLELSASTVKPKDAPSTQGQQPVKISGTLTLKPSYLSYAASAAKNLGSGTKHVGLAVGFSDTAQKKSDEINEEKTFAIFRYDLGRLEIGKRYIKELLDGTGASVALTEEQSKKSAFNITAVVSESEDPGLLFQVLQKTFTDEKADLQKALEEAITNAINKTKPPSP